MEFQKTNLGELSVNGKGSYGIAASAVPYSDELFTYLRITDINDDGTLNKSGLMSVSDEKAEQYLLKPNDIVFARTGGSTGRSYFYDGTDGEFVYAGFLIKFSIDSTKVNPRFIKYYCLSQEYRGWVHSFNTGSTRGNINAQTYANMSILLPSREQQDLLVDTLSVIDEKIKLNTAINENLEQQIQAILLNMIQQDSKKDCIETVKLGEYLYIKGRIGWKGLKKDEYLDSSDYRIINGESLTKDGIDWNKAGFISKERYDESPEIMLQVGDILLSKDGTIGKIGYVDNLDSPSTVASGIFVIRNIKPDIISTQFIYYLLKSKLFSAFIASRTEGSVIPHLYQKDFMEFAFPLPNADEMSQFDALTSPLFATVIKNLRENEFLTATRDALLPKLMNGEIDVSAVRI